ncbi:hypothetical protein [Albimonas pacifica]|uniref:Uncharacterized protein n=1 Tax=Albimonas pacifica TaxID=1114924 RepID=A0A1I3JLF8_9RHOB|nr:hypothetical protein [Albimonas pacifica]SFI60838.1 hypothetical protein SAMN05216258_10850 [Albimonas pacifica]
MSIAASRIAQQAFRYCEMSALSSFGDDSPEARAAAEQYPLVRDAGLRRADWSFASELLELSEATGMIADDDLPYAYQLPPRVLAVREVLPELTAWRIDGRLMRTDEPTLQRFRATVQITNENLLPAEFADYLAYLLASRLSPVFASSANRATSLEQRAEAAFVLALRADRGQASAQRWDGLTGEGDWAGLVVR